MQLSDVSDAGRPIITTEHHSAIYGVAGVTIPQIPRLLGHLVLEEPAKGTACNHAHDLLQSPRYFLGGVFGLQGVESTEQNASPGWRAHHQDATHNSGYKAKRRVGYCWQDSGGIADVLEHAVV